MDRSIPSRRDGKSESRLDGIDRDDFQKAKLIAEVNVFRVHASALGQRRKGKRPDAIPSDLSSSCVKRTAVWRKR